MDTEDEVKRYLELNGFRVIKIEEAEDKTPDFLVHDSAHTYLLEVKDKLPDPRKAEWRQKVLDAGKMHQSVESTGRTNTISSVVKEAAQQLAAFTNEKVDFRLLWFQSRGIDPEMLARQMCATIYGIKTVVPVYPKAEARDCFYAAFNDFYRYKETLDAVILVHHDLGQLCCNSFSKRLDDLLTSKFAKLFGQGVLNPIVEEKSGNAFVADFDCDRKNRPEFLKMLGEKYGFDRMVEFDFKHLSAEISIPNPLATDDKT